MLKYRIIFCVAVFLAVMQAASALTPRQAAMQSAIDGWGDIGEAFIVDTPNNGGLYSLKFYWRCEPVTTTPFWYAGWHASAKGYDTLSLDLMIAENNGKAKVNIYLVESDGDRWLTDIDTTELQLGEWRRFEVKQADFRLNGLGNNKKEWDSIKKIIIEPRGKDGEITFYLDNIHMTGLAGKKDLLDPANLPRPYSDIPKDHKPLNSISPAGFAFVAGNMGFWESEKYPANTEDFCRFSPSLAVSTHGFDGYEKAGKLSEKLRKLGRPLLVEHPNAKDFAVELTEAQAWCVRWDGESNNLTPGKFNIVHTGCVCNPAFLEMNKRRADAIPGIGDKHFLRGRLRLALLGWKMGIFQSRYRGLQECA